MKSQGTTARAVILAMQAIEKQKASKQRRADRLEYQRWVEHAHGCVGCGMRLKMRTDAPHPQAPEVNEKEKAAFQAKAVAGGKGSSFLKKPGEENIPPTGVPVGAVPGLPPGMSQAIAQAIAQGAKTLTIQTEGEEDDHLPNALKKPKGGGDKGGGPMVH